jgi:signal transduction histidine kinase
MTDWTNDNRRLTGAHPAMLIGLIVLSAFGHYVAWSTFLPFVPLNVMRLWTNYSLGFFSLWLITAARQLYFIWPELRPDPYWPRYGQFMALAQALLICFDIWLLMPHGSPVLQMGVILFCFAYAAISISAIPSWRRINTTVICAICGSLSAACILFKTPYWQFVSPAIILFSLCIYAFNITLANALDSERLARFQAERERDARMRFLASASHDLGQPLQSARLYFDQAFNMPDPSRRSAAVANAKDALSTMAIQLRRIIDRLRLESGVVAPRMKIAAISILIEHATQRADARAASKNVQLTQLPTSALVHVDPELADRALSNLIDNAIRHGKANRVLVGAVRRGGKARIYVIDDGVGVAESDRHVIFEDYAQGTDHGDEIRGGFGLGLASARRSAELMGGTVELDARWKKGSAFFLELMKADMLVP